TRPSTGFSRLWNSLRWLIASPPSIACRSALAVTALVAALADRDQRRLLARDLRLHQFEQGRCCALRERHHAILVADHDVAGRYHRAADRYRHVDLARAALVGTAVDHRAGKAREVAGGERGDVADRAVD